MVFNTGKVSKGIGAALYSNGQLPGWVGQLGWSVRFKSAQGVN